MEKRVEKLERDKMKTRQDKKREELGNLEEKMRNTGMDKRKG